MICLSMGLMLAVFLVFPMLVVVTVHCAGARFHIPAHILTLDRCIKIAYILGCNNNSLFYCSS